MDWKKLLWGNNPQSLDGWIREVKRLRLFLLICFVAFLLIFFGGLQQKGEIESCWAELYHYRVMDVAVGGVVDSAQLCINDTGMLVACDDEVVGSGGS